MAVQLLTNRPSDFDNPAEVVTCFCEWQDKILVLKRHPEDLHGETWNVPGGGLEPDEEPFVGAARELLEETGILVALEQLKSLGTVYIRLPDTRYAIHMFYAPFDTKPEVAVSLEENTEAKWVTVDEALQMTLIPAGHEALEHYRSLRKP